MKVGVYDDEPTADTGVEGGRPSTPNMFFCRSHAPYCVSPILEERRSAAQAKSTLAAARADNARLRRREADLSAEVERQSSALQKAEVQVSCGNTVGLPACLAYLACLA